MSNENKTRGIATLFNQFEIKSFLKNYLIFIGIIEAIIFFVCFIEQLGGEKTPFPWKDYFFAAFIIPVIITFLLGVLVAGFNKYLFGSIHHESKSLELTLTKDESEKTATKKVEAFLNLIQKLPFLLTLFILSVVAGIIYKLNAIISFITRTGEKSMEFFAVLIVALLGITTLFIIIWLILNYKLQKKSIEYKHSYRESVIKQLGMIILDDETVLDKNGKIISENSNQKSKKNMFKPELPKGFLEKKNNLIQPDADETTED